MTRFADRHAAGQALAEALAIYANRSDVIVLGLPRGGVPVAAEVARVLHAPLDLIVVRKLGAPMQPELALGAIASGGARVIDEGLVRTLGVHPADVASVEAAERTELIRREAAYRSGRSLPSLADRTVILVDDGVATGATMRAAVQAVRMAAPRRIVVAVPVAPPEVLERLRTEVDEVVCVHAPARFVAVGRWYQRFPQLTDADVRSMLTT